MGDFVIRIHAVGGHGHNREIKDGENVPVKCTSSHPNFCVDCLANEFVENLRKIADIKVASLTHWDAELPGYNQSDEVRDDLLTHKRRGNFNG